ncbi:hypothetical protein GCM10010246_01680 [Streptomyces cuspidosporus]|uniref:Uncharacterized protein n=1 Tax=Streptomyces cuspidosporus TaxID=66882 RepID=A0ABN3F9G4_9ACTN
MSRARSSLETQCVDVMRCGGSAGVAELRAEGQGVMKVVDERAPCGRVEVSGTGGDYTGSGVPLQGVGDTGTGAGAGQG